MDYIKIEGYKSIKSVRIDLEPINILIGSNGSGKSNLISFFDFLNRLFNRNLNDYIALSGGADKILHKGQKVTNQIKFKVEFGNGINGYSCILEWGQGNFVFTSEKLFYNGIGKEIGYSSNEADLKKTDNYRAPFIIAYLNSFRKYHFHDTGTTSAFTKLSNIENDIHYLYSDGSNLAAFLYYIFQNHKITYNLIVNTIQSIAPYFSDFYIIPNEENYVRLLWKDKYSDLIYGPNDLSDGTLRFIALVTLFLQPKLPSTIVIDEPELGLHPKAISKIAGLIKSVAAKKSQVIIATQSTDLISHFSPNDIITVDQINGESVFNRLQETDLESWLEEYTLDDLWKRNIITTGQPN